MWRTADIPDNFMLKWQSETHRATKTTRRPMTACQTCRSAKIKCDRKAICGHCSARGIACVYNKSKSSPTSTKSAVRNNSQSAQGAQGATAVDGGALQTASEPSHPAISTDATPTGPSSASTLDNEIAPPPVDKDAAASANHHTDPYREDAWLDLLTPSMTTAIPTTSAPYPGDDAWHLALDIPLDLATSVSHAPNLPMPDYSTDNFSSLHTSSDSEGSVHATVSSTGSTGSSSTATNSSVFVSAKCGCRDKLAKSRESLSDAMLNNKTNDIFHVTSDFMHSCQGIIDCSLCTIGCTDLVCLITLFQQAGVCFQHIAAGDPKQQLIKLQFGDIFVAVSDPRMRLMAVMNLVQQAINVVNAIGNRGKNMLDALSNPSQLALTNIDYLNTTISDIKGVLDQVVAVSKQTEGVPG
ncbi:fungal zn(2)-Cys(6) binuclear cluster domain-containing protein [Sarocladium implicatum]|nr:fungal zn(2)-Cys(6) binuclear cluster domain-containing protein [Sarocladium implicatum]